MTYAERHSNVNIHTDRGKTSKTSEYAQNELCARLGGCPWRVERARKSLHEHRTVVVGRSLFFPLSLRHIRVRVIIFLRPAMETHTYSREERRRSVRKKRGIETYFIHQQHLARRYI